MGNKAIEVLLDEELLAAMNAWAEEEGITLEEFVRRACRELVTYPTTAQRAAWANKDAEIYAQSPEVWDPNEWKDYWPKRKRKQRAVEP